MKSIAIAAALTLILAGTALAAPKRMPHADRVTKAMAGGTGAYDVTINGRVIGRDPDPAIRQSLSNDYHLWH